MRQQQPYIEELASAVSIGLLAEEMVFAASKLLRGSELSEESERIAVASGKALLEALIAPHAGMPPAPALKQLSTDDEALDALHAVLVQAPGKDVETYLRRLTDVLSAALEGEDVSAKAEDVEAIRNLFADLGRLTLGRANNLSRSSQERLSWLTSPATLPS